jgi:hypothetical protein
MNAPEDPGRTALRRLAQALVDDIMETSDEELLAEFRATEGDPARHAAAMRAQFERTVLTSRKHLLKAAQAGVAADRSSSARGKVISLRDAKERLRQTLAACPPDLKLTLAARNEDELSDADVRGMLEDLAELGITLRDDESNGQT